jgi:hypothetical protein
MAKPDLSIEARRNMIQKIVKWIAFGFLALVLLVVGFVGFGMYRVARFFKLHQAFLNADASAMQNPANYKPAELYLARLMQSDPALWKSENGDPPDWLPPELGRLDPHEFSISLGSCAIGGGGGLDDFFGCHLDPDPDGNTTSKVGFVLTYLGQGPEIVLDRFAIAKTDHIEEDEFVKSALAELARRQAAFANGSQPNLYGDNHIVDRRRLLTQHPAIAAKLAGTLAAPKTENNNP